MFFCGRCFFIVDIIRWVQKGGIMAKKTRVYYGWAAFDEDAKKLARRIRRVGLPKNIYGKPRGGLILAVRLSHLLKRSMILEEDQIGRDTLIVDDTCDTGATLSRLANLTDYPIATLFNNEFRKIKVPRIIYAQLTHGAWIVFPWESKRSSAVVDNT
jgi:hypoxanthine phosphoribosyltransferase